MKYLINTQVLIRIKFSRFLIKFSERVKPRFILENILNKNFPVNSNFSFVQIGAHDGKSFDFLYDFLKLRKCNGIVVEPINFYFEKLVMNFSSFENVKAFNLAIHDSQSNVSIFRVASKHLDKYPDWAEGISSVLLSHLDKFRIERSDIEEEVVPAVTLMELITLKPDLPPLDLIQIDVEGFDYEILKMIDFREMKPSIIKFECVNLSSADLNSSITLLRKNGYFVFQEMNDCIAINLKKIII